MKIENVEVLILKIEERASKKGDRYFILRFTTVDDGQVFDVIVRDFNKIKDLEVFQRTVINLKLNNSKFGLNLSLI